MRRAWSFVVAIVLLGIMAFNLLLGNPILDIKVVAVGVVIIAVTLTWWFEESGRR